jgi:hypothetical protein
MSVPFLPITKAQAVAARDHLRSASQHFMAFYYGAVCNDALAHQGLTALAQAVSALGYDMVPRAQPTEEPGYHRSGYVAPEDWSEPEPPAVTEAAGFDGRARPGDRGGFVIGH